MTQHYQKISWVGEVLLPVLGVPTKMIDLPCKEIVDYVEREYKWDFYMCNVVKYLYRVGQKDYDCVPDLSKALQYLEWEHCKRVRQLWWMPSRIKQWWIGNDYHLIAISRSIKEIKSLLSLQENQNFLN